MIRLDLHRVSHACSRTLFKLFSLLHTTGTNASSSGLLLAFVKMQHTVYRYVSFDHMLPTSYVQAHEWRLAVE